jgi:outer membrane protein TolC
LIAVALMNRPELAESRAQIAAALARWNQAKYRPLFPILQASYGGGTFIGGTTAPNTAGGRNDVLTTMSWELKNFGLGDLFASRERRAQYNQANFHALEVQSMVGAQVAAATKIVRQREQAVQEAQTAVRSAEEMWRKLEQVAFGVGLPARQYDPLEPLLAERALLEARMLYLDNVIEYNRNQFRLYWAMGQPPVCALPHAAAVPVGVNVMPPANQPSAREREKGKSAVPEKKDAPVLLPLPRMDPPR